MKMKISLATLVRRLRNAIAEPYGVASIRTVMDAQQKPFREFRHSRRSLRVFRSAQVKDCTVAGCGGIMRCDLAHWPSAIKWTCDREGDHRELVMTMKPCIVAGCNGSMRWQPPSAMWTCDRDSKHREPELHPPPVR